MIKADGRGQGLSRQRRSDYAGPGLSAASHLARANGDESRLAAEGLRAWPVRWAWDVPDRAPSGDGGKHHPSDRGGRDRPTDRQVGQGLLHLGARTLSARQGGPSPEAASSSFTWCVVSAASIGSTRAVGAAILLSPSSPTIFCSPPASQYASVQRKEFGNRTPN